MGQGLGNSPTRALGIMGQPHVAPSALAGTSVSSRKETRVLGQPGAVLGQGRAGQPSEELWAVPPTPPQGQARAASSKRGEWQ